MPELSFQVENAEATPNAAAPQLTFKLRVSNAGPEPIHSIALRVQAQIEPARRRYAPEEQQKLKELFGEPERWSQSLHPLVWAIVSVPVPAFRDSTLVDVPIPCTFDFNVALTKYIYGLEDGELPTTLLLSGTVFYGGARGLQVAQIPWDREAGYRLPVRVWKEMMDLYYPKTVWLPVPRDVFERLDEFRLRCGIATWEQTLERLLEAAAVKS